MGSLTGLFRHEFWARPPRMSHFFHTFRAVLSNLAGLGRTPLMTRATSSETGSSGLPNADEGQVPPATSHVGTAPDEVDFFDIPQVRKQQEAARRAQEEQEQNEWVPVPAAPKPEELLPAIDLTEPPVVIPGPIPGVEISISSGCIVTIKHATGVYWFFGYDRTAALVEFADAQGRTWRRVGQDLMHHFLWRNEQGTEWSGDVQPLLDGRVLLLAGDGDWTEILADGVGTRYCPGADLPILESDATGPCRIEGKAKYNTRVRVSEPDDEGFANWLTGEHQVELLRVSPHRGSLWLERPDGVSRVYSVDGERLEQPVRGPEDFEAIYEKMLSRLDRDSDGAVFLSDIDAAVMDASFTGEEVQLLAALKKRTYRDGGVGIVKSLFDLTGTAERGLCLSDVRALSRRLRCGLAAISVLDNEEIVESLNEIRGWNAASQGFISRDMLQKLAAELRSGRNAEHESIATAINELVRWMNGLNIQQTNSRDLRARLLTDVELYRAVQAAMNTAYEALQTADSTDSRRLFGECGDPRYAIRHEAVLAGPESANKFFLCALASLASLAPEVIEQMIVFDGVDYIVRFAGDPHNPVTVREPVEAQLGVFAHGGRFGTWVTIIEEAFNIYCRSNSEKLKCASGLSWYGDSLVAELLTGSDAKVLSRWYGQTNYITSSYSSELQYKIGLMDRKALSDLLATGHAVVLSTNHPELSNEESNQDLALIDCNEEVVRLANPSQGSAERYLSGPLPPRVYATTSGELLIQIEDLPKYFFRAVGCLIPQQDLDVRQFLSKLQDA